MKALELFTNNPGCRCCSCPLLCSTMESHHPVVCTCQNIEKLTWTQWSLIHLGWSCQLSQLGQLKITIWKTFNWNPFLLTYALIYKGKRTWFSRFGSTNSITRKWLFFQNILVRNKAENFPPSPVVHLCKSFNVIKIFRFVIVEYFHYPWNKKRSGILD